MKRVLTRLLLVCIILQLALPATIWHQAQAAVVPSVVIIDQELNGGAGYTELSGNWADSGGIKGYNNSNTRYAGAPGSKAKWTPDLTPGNYGVSIYKPVNPTGGDPASVVEVVYNGGSYQTTLNYSAGTSQWVHLGSFDFRDGTDGYVTLTYSNTSGKTVRADAVKFERIQAVQPEASLTSPVKTEDAAVNTGIALSFSQRMDASTLSEGGVVLKETASQTVVESVYTVGEDSKSISLKPVAFLKENTSYTVQILQHVRDRAGMALTGTTSWSFVTAVATPLQASLSFEGLQPVGQSLGIAFSKPVDPQSIHSTAAILKEAAGGLIVNAELHLSQDATNLELQYAPLKPNTEYILSLDEHIRDTMGNILTGSRQWSFTTQPVRFVEGFADGTPDGWQLGGDSWKVKQVADGPLGGTAWVLSQTHLTATIDVSLIGDTSWTDYTYSMKFRPVNTPVAKASGIVFRAIDSKNFFVIRFLNGGSTKLLELGKVSAGSYSAVQSVSYSWSDGSWYDVAVAVSGGNGSLSINGQTVMTMSGLELFPAGGVGFRTFTSQMDVADIEVRGSITLPRQELGLAALAESTGVRLTWPASPEERTYRYRIFRGEKDAGGGNMTYSPVSGPLDELTFLDTAVLPGKSYSYYLELLDQSLASFSRSEDTTITLMNQEEPMGAIQNGSYRLEFSRTTLGGESFVMKRIYMKNAQNQWIPVTKSPLDERYGVLHFPEVSLQYARDSMEQAHPQWTVSGAVYTDPYMLENIQWVRPAQVSITENGSQAVLAVSRAEQFDLQWTWSFESENGWPMVEQKLVPRQSGYWGLLSNTFSGLQYNEVDNVQLGMYINSKRIPPGAFLLPEYQLPNPVVLVENQADGIGKLNTGLAPLPTEIPNRMAKLENSRFGLLIKGPDGRVQPGIMSPVPGTAESQAASGEELAFRYYYVIEQADQWSTYKKIAQDVYNFHDYRTSPEHSLTDAVHNMMDLMMNDEASQWWDRAKGYKDVEINQSVKLASSLTAMEAYLLTGDRSIYEKRVLPTIEFLLSRSDKIFSPVTSEPNSAMGGPALGAEALLPLYAMGQSATVSLYQKGMESVQNPAKVKSLMEYLAVYRQTAEPSYLDSARSLADDMIRRQLTGDRSAANRGSDFVWTLWPDWMSLLELYDITKNETYLDAAVKGANQFLTSVWVQPVPGDHEMVTLPNAPLPKNPFGWWTGERVGWPYNASDLPLTTVPAKQVSQAGLHIEQGTTYEEPGGYGYVMNPGWAGALLRLSELTEDSFYKDVARSSVVGRFANYPGYYYRQWLTTQMDPQYPYNGPDVTELYYHHIPVQFGLTLDFLMSDLAYRSHQAISFQGLAEPGLRLSETSYLWFRYMVYGHEQGQIYGNDHMQLWLPKGLVQTGNPQVSWLGATDGTKLAIPLLNYDETETTANLQLDLEQIGGGALMQGLLLDENGQSVPVTVTDGRISVTIPAKGLRTLMLDGLDIRLETLTWRGNGLTPAEQAPSYNKNITGNPRLGTVEGSLIVGDGESYDAYVYTTVKDTEISQAILHYNAGDGWKTAVKSNYPFEFSVGPVRQEYPFTYFVETRAASGVVNVSDLRTLRITDKADWRQSRLSRQFIHAQDASALPEIAAILGNVNTQTLKDKITELTSMGEGMMVLAAEDALAPLIQLQGKIAELQMWLAIHLPENSSPGSAKLHEALSLAHNMVHSRLQELVPADLDIVFDAGEAVPGAAQTITAVVANRAEQTITGAVLKLLLPDEWSLAPESIGQLELGDLAPGEVITRTLRLEPVGPTPVAALLIPARLEYSTVEGASISRYTAAKTPVKVLLELNASPSSAVTLAGTPLSIAVTLVNHSADMLAGTLQGTLPAGWKLEGELSFSGLASGDRIQRTLTLTSAQEAGELQVELALEATTQLYQSPAIPLKITNTRNSALAKFGTTAAASSSLSAYPPDRAIDGKAEASVTDRWVSTNEENIHWLQLDLGTERTIDRIVIRHMGVRGDARYNTADFSVQTAADPLGEWTDLAPPAVGNINSISDIRFEPVTVRYLRMRITQGSSVDNYGRIYEFEAYLAQSEPDNQPTTLQLEGTDSDLKVGDPSRQLAAYALYEDGTREDVTSQASFEGTPSTVALVSGNGIIQAVGPGTVSITAEWQNMQTHGAIQVKEAEEQGKGNYEEEPPPEKEPEKPPVSGSMLRLNDEAYVLRRETGENGTTLHVSLAAAGLAAARQHLNQPLPRQLQLDIEPAERVSVSLPADVLLQKGGGTQGSSLLIRTGGAGLLLPVDSPQWTEGLAQLGASPGEVSIVISLSQADWPESLQPVFGAGQYSGKAEPLSPLVHFEITMTAGGLKATVTPTEVNGFTRLLGIGTEVSPSLLTVVEIDPDTGAYQFAPAYFNSGGDAPGVVIRHHGNGSYALLRSEQHLPDTAGHWAEADLQLLANKMLVQGDQTGFHPDDSISRSAFITLLTRGLGLGEHSLAGAVFGDVKKGDWFAGAVGAAYQAGLIEGSEDGLLDPYASITREQIAVLVARAMNLIRLEIVGEAGSSPSIAGFVDGHRISVWAREACAQVVEAGLLQGNETGSLSPQAPSTRAEAAVIVKRLLQKAGYMNEVPKISEFSPNIV